MELILNSVYKRNNSYWRLVGSDGDQCWLYPLGSGGIKCEMAAATEILSELQNGKTTQEPDPYLEIKGAPVTQKAAERWNLIKEIVTDNGILFNVQRRAEKIKEIWSGQGTYPLQIYRLLAMWWEKGQCAAGLNPVGKRTPKKEGTAKTGPAKLISKSPMVDDAMRRELEKAYRKYLLKEDPCSMRLAHRYFLADYRKGQPDIPVEELPTIWQFKYWFKKSHGRREVQVKQHSKAQWEKDLRPLESNVYEIVDGPGCRYEIDSTQADVHLVRESDRSRLVGRPTLYLVTDTYSGMIVGATVTLDDPQYKCAADALYSAFTDKESQCNAVGIELLENEWPAKGIPLEIVADNGEMKTWRIEKFARSYGVRITQTAPYRADQKGTVESLLGAVQKILKAITPGVPDKKRSKKAGYREKTREAVLTLSEYRKLVLLAVLQVNRRTKEISPPGLGLPAPRTPLNIWRRADDLGKVHLTQPVDLSRLRLALLPMAKCTLSRRGILANGIRYRCANALDAGYFDRGIDEKRPGGVLAYDPADISRAWFYPDQKKKPELCWECKLAAESEYLQGKCLKEAKLMIKANKGSISQEEKESLERLTELSAMQLQIVENAKNSSVKPEESNAKRLSQLRGNRQIERIVDEKSNKKSATRGEEKAKKEPGEPKGNNQEKDEVPFSSLGYPQRVEDIPD